ncbi:DUF6443 domain-containing protein [Flavobacterium sp.]|uniref:DUF6443 domain-containing protein n=1 Tax=Flavobacterium sp. TaxID=239 RepID=UPI003A8F55CF
MRPYLIFIQLLLYTFAFGQTSSHNYIKTTEPKVPTTIFDYQSSAFVPSPSNSLINIQYKDGLNRNEQIIEQGASTNGNDIVSYIAYDEFGRKSKSYFPFATSTTAFGGLFTLPNNGSYVLSAQSKQLSYYASANTYHDNTPFRETVFDGSPLNRVKETSRGGDDWKIISGDTDHTVKLSYGVNVSNEVRKNIITSDYKLINNSQFYSNGLLVKSKVKNENWVSSDGNLNTVETFSDKNGKKIADIAYVSDGGVTKKLVTEYVYDNKGLLRYVLSPKAAGYDFNAYSEQTGNRSWNFTQFLTSSVSGGGSVSASINNGTLTLIFSGGFSSSSLKTGHVVYLDDRIPDTTVGVLGCTSCGSNYTVYIEDGYLSIGAENPTQPTTGFNATYTVNIGSNISFLNNQQFLDKYAHQYIYDEYNRKIGQKNPGRGWEYSVYDKLDRPILTQDENLKAQNKWLFIKYDVNGRVVYTGTYSSSLSRDSLQASVDNFINNSGNLTNYEGRVKIPTLGFTGGVSLYYTNNAFPTTGINVLTINYYDNYNFLTPPVAPPISVEGQVVTNNVQGLQTVTYTRNLSGSSSYWTSTWTFYDEEARPIYVYLKNYLGGYTISTTQYDFRGNILKVVTKHKRTSNQTNPELVITDRYTYDNCERQLAHYQKINSQPEESVSVSIYDGLGQLVEKKIGGLTTGTSLQNVKYKYDIHGWLTDINDVDNLGGDLYAYHLNYNEVAGAGVALYNGDVTQARWASNLNGSVNSSNGYDFSYDKLRRLTYANYIGNGTNANGAFNEIVSYDINGNIETLKRTSLSGTIDNLLYRYDGNQLVNVEDTANTQGFNNGTTFGSTLDDYEYDANGNVIKDRNKGITNITYNHLDLPELVTFSSGATIQFRYDATGSKILKIYTLASGAVVTTDYLGGFQYQDATLQYFPTSEGYVTRNTAGSNEYFSYIYNYLDQTGNVRLSYKGSSSLIIEEHFLSGVGSFTAINSATVSNSNYKLSVTVPGGLISASGTQRNILNNVASGTRVTIKGNAGFTSSKFNPSSLVQAILVVNTTSGTTNQILGSSLSGDFEFDYYFPTAATSVYLKFVVPGGTTGYSFTFNIDDLYVYTKNLQTVSATNYYPYGLTHAGEYIIGGGSVYNYKYQGKELQTETGFGYYDFGSRLYEPSVGRWFTPDPQNQFVSPYLAFANNPICSIDPNGEYAIIDDVIAIVVGGAINLAANWDNIDDFGDGVSYFLIGAAAGEATLYAGPLAGAAITGFGNNAYRQLSNPDYQEFDFGSFITEGVVSIGTSYIGGAIGARLTGPVQALYSKIPNVLAQQYLTNTTINCSTGVLLGYGLSKATGNEFDLWSTLRTSFISSSIGFGVDKFTGHVKGYFKNKSEQVKTTEQETLDPLKDFEKLEGTLNLEPTPAQQATLHQTGNGDYGNADNWRNINLKAGTILVQGMGGTSPYYTTYTGLYRAKFQMETLWTGLQVAPHPSLGYRRQVGLFRVTETIPAAFGTTYANPQQGPGGVPQLFIPKAVGLERFHILDLKQ